MNYTLSNKHCYLTTLNIRAAGDAEDDQDDDSDGSGGALVVQEAKPALRQPPLYQVILHNDDFTPMEFVVDVLLKFFRLDQTKATQIMLEVHTKGKGVCGVYTAEIAETKVAQVNSYARKNQHPLLCSAERI